MTTGQYAKVVNGVVTVYPYTDAAMRADNPNTSFGSEPTDADRKAFGVYPVSEGIKPDFNPVRQIAAPTAKTSWTVDSSKVTMTYALHDLTLNDRRPASVYKTLKDKGTACLNAGFAYDFGGNYGILHLQLRDSDDKVNWMIAKDQFLSAIAQGAGDMPVGFLRTAENIEVAITPNEGLEVLALLSAWGISVLKWGWNRQDALTKATTHIALDTAIGAINDPCPQ